MSVAVEKRKGRPARNHPWFHTPIRTTPTPGAAQVPRNANPLRSR